MTSRPAPRDPDAFLPLTDLAFSVLVALTDEQLHGYALIKELRQRTGRAGLRTGTVYAALSRLRDDGLVEETEGATADGDETDERRRYYTATDLGVSVARAEAARLQEMLGLARAKQLTTREA